VRQRSKPWQTVSLMNRTKRRKFCMHCIGPVCRRESILKITWFSNGTWGRMPHALSVTMNYYKIKNQWD
jgi:hypothetical protein